MRLLRLSKRVAAVVIGSAALLPAPVSAAGPCPNADARPDQISVTDYAASLLCEVNAVRGDWGLPEVVASTALAKAAAGQAAEMVERDYFSHTSPDGHTFADRLSAVRFIPRSGNWGAGENLAAGEDANGTPAAIADAWMRSPDHRVNMLDPDFRVAGIGVARGMPTVPQPATDAMTVALDLAWRRHGARASR